MDNFYDTAKRMHKSSETLHNNNEFHNACYLAGYVVECYAKIIIEVFSTAPPRSFSHNLGRLNSELNSILSGNASLSQYILNGPSDFATVLSNWNPVSLRYIANFNSLSRQTKSNSFQAEIHLAMQKLAQLHIDGYI